MKSMTGYGYASFNGADWQLETEIKSYNNRYLDIVTNINSALASYEEEVTRAVKKVASRGKVEVSLRLKVFTSNSTVHVDELLLEQYIRAFDLINRDHGTSLHFDASSLLSVEGLVTTSSESDPSIYREAVESCLERALADFEASKRREGEETKKDLIRLGESFRSCLDRIAGLTEGYENYFRDLLLERYRELEIADRYDETKMMQEIGMLLVKYSINEEQNRLRTHVKEYFRILESEEEAGKKLDFLCQEMNREVNTTASKSQNVDITMLTVQMKDDLENIREQIRNIE